MIEAIGRVDRSLSTLIYEHLLEAIIQGRLSQGAKLIEQDLAEQLGVSRVPLREAMPLLQAEGFVTSTPRRGTFVAHLTYRDVEELFDVRESLEPTAARLAARRVAEHGPGTLASLARCLERGKSSQRGRSANYTTISANSAAFHHEVVVASGNQLLLHVMKPINGKARWLAHMTSPHDSKSAIKEHIQLFKAIERGDEDAAFDIARQHIRAGRDISLSMIEDLVGGNESHRRGA